MKSSDRHRPWGWSYPPWAPYVIYIVIVVYVLVMKSAGVDPNAALVMIIAMAAAAAEVIKHLTFRPGHSQPD